MHTVWAYSVMLLSLLQLYVIESEFCDASLFFLDVCIGRPDVTREKPKVCGSYLTFHTLTHHQVMFTGVVDEEGEETVRLLGGELVNSVYDCTHLVTDKVNIHQNIETNWSQNHDSCCLTTYLSISSLELPKFKMMFLSLHPNIIVHVENVVSLFSSPSTSSQKVRKCGGHKFLSQAIYCGQLVCFSRVAQVCRDAAGS